MRPGAGPPPRGGQPHPCLRLYCRSTACAQSAAPPRSIVKPCASAGATARKFSSAARQVQDQRASPDARRRTREHGARRNGQAARTHGLRDARHHALAHGRSRLRRHVARGKAGAAHGNDKRHIQLVCGMAQRRLDLQPVARRQRRVRHKKPLFLQQMHDMRPALVGALPAEAPVADGDDGYLKHVQLSLLSRPYRSRLHARHSPPVSCGRQPCYPSPQPRARRPRWRRMIPLYHVSMRKQQSASRRISCTHSGGQT